MATRQDLWVANEILRFADIIHDCLDACRYLLKGLEPDTGSTLEIPKDVEIETVEAYAAERIRSHSNAALVHKAALLEFITKIGSTAAQDALSALNIDASIIIADVNTMETYATYIYDNVLTEDHTVMATYLDTNLSKFVSIRRRWAL